jgi:hypothetical protein
MGDSEQLFPTGSPSPLPFWDDPAAATAISEDGVDLGLVLGEGYQDRQEVQQQIYALYCAYMHYRHTAPTEQQAWFPHCRIFKGKPPGFMHDFVQRLEAEVAISSSSGATPSFPMKQAVCIVDKFHGDDPKRAKGDRVSWEGDPTRYPGTPQGLGKNGDHFMARKGCDKIPPNNSVKPWKFEVISKDNDPLDQFYVCLFVPFSHKPRAANLKKACPELIDDGDPAVAAMIKTFVAAMSAEQQRRGQLTEGDEQIKRYQTLLTKQLKKIACDFIGHPKWADHVFDPNYRQAKWAEVCEFIDTHGHLPWIRSEADVKETGIDLEKDHVRLLEAVENFFLYLRDMFQRIDNLHYYQLPVDCCQMLQPEELRRRRCEFRSRVREYSNLSPKMIAHQAEGPSTREGLFFSIWSVIKLRPYQLEAVDRCLTDNRIVNLPTGSGKTLIAVKLIDHFVTRFRV